MLLTVLLRSDGMTLFSRRGAVDKALDRLAPVRGRQVRVARDHGKRPPAAELLERREALADRAGMHRTYGGSVERAERNVSVDNICRLAWALGVEVRELLAPEVRSR